MPLPWTSLLLLVLPLLLQQADVAEGSSSRRWPGYGSHHNFKPFKPKRARFAAPLNGFSNIFQDNGIGQWATGGFPSMQSTAWSDYPGSPHRLQPIPLARNHYQSYTAPPPAQVPAPAPAPAQLNRHHSFLPARNIQRGKVPTHFMTDAELHGLVCVPASSLASALAEHRDRVTKHRDGSLTQHRTVLAGTDGVTSHSTRITSAGRSTVVETRTNSSSGHQQHRQSVRDTGAGLVRTATGSAFADGRPGLPSLADVITSSSSEGSSSQSRASASGYDIDGNPLPARSVSQSVSRSLGGQDITSLTGSEDANEEVTLTERSGQPGDDAEGGQDSATSEESHVAGENKPDAGRSSESIKAPKSGPLTAEGRTTEDKVAPSPSPSSPSEKTSQADDEDADQGDDADQIDSSLDVTAERVEESAEVATEGKREDLDGQGSEDDD